MKNHDLWVEDWKLHVRQLRDVFYGANFSAEEWKEFLSEMDDIIEAAHSNAEEWNRE